MTYILYNPLAGNGRSLEKLEEIRRLLGGRETVCLDATQTDVQALLRTLSAQDEVVIAGGDGTLNRLINALGGRAPRQSLYYYPAGSGNDFMTDVRGEAGEGLVPLNEYLSRLPVVEVNGEKHYFLNGVGYGIDGYCCEEGDRQRARGKGRVNYTAIAIRGLLGGYRPRRARVTVDGETRLYRHVWLAPTMNGRYYGGGMRIAPDQARLNPEGTLSVVVFHWPGKLRTLAVFPSIFKGEHVRRRDMTDVRVGREIQVEFDRPTALQIDGETCPGVRAYRAWSSAQEAAQERAV